MKSKTFFFLFLLLIGGSGAIISMTHFVDNLGNLVRPLPFSGPNNGIVTDFKSQKPISHATIEASWWCHDSFWPDIPGSFYVRAYGITDTMGRFTLTKPNRRSGWFGESFHLTISARGYLPVVIFAAEKHPLPSATTEWPFHQAQTLPSIPNSLNVALTPAVPVLIETLKSVNPNHQAYAAEILAGLGRKAAPAETALIELLNNGDKLVREKSASALGFMAASLDNTVPALIQALSDQDHDLVQAAAEALGWIGPEAFTAIPSLIDLLLGDDQSGSERARDALAKMGNGAHDALEAALAARQKESMDGYVNKIQEAMKLQVFENDCPTAKPVYAGPAELTLIQAANDGDTSLVHKLLKMGAEPHAIGVGGQTALFNAAQKGHLPIVNLLLEHGAKPDTKTIADGTPLHIAARKKRTEVVKTLLQHGANPNIRSKWGFTPLMRAADNGDKTSVTGLLEHGADVNLQNYKGLTALRCAQSSDHKDIVMLLREHGAIDFAARKRAYKQAEQQRIAQQRKTEFLKDVTSEDVHVKNKALWAALEKEKTADVEALIEIGAQVNSRNKAGETPLMMAARRQGFTLESQ